MNTANEDVDHHEGRFVAIVRRPITAVATLWLVVVLTLATLGPLMLRFGPLDQDLLSARSGPTTTHWLGTDTLGRDILARLASGSHPTLLGTSLAVVVFLVFGVTLGVVAGYFGGWVDRFVSLFAELVFAIPGIIILLVVLAVFGNSAAVSMIALGLLGSAGLVRVLRGNAMIVKHELYVRAARTSGLTEMQILRCHVLPRLRGPILVQTFLFAGAAMMVETAIGFLGFGTSPPKPSWGNLVADASQAINTHPWLLIPTGGTIMFTVLSLGLVGDAVRDIAVDHVQQSVRSRRPKMRSSAVATATNGVDVAERSALLSVRGLSVSVVGGTDVVTNIDFEVNKGEFVGLVGESGCGKSVTGLAVLGLLKSELIVSRGSIIFDGVDLMGQSTADRRRVRGRGIAFISQEPVSSLDPAFTVGQQLREIVRRHHRLDRRMADSRVCELLRMVQLDDAEAVRKCYPHQLSGGMAQRVGIAAAIAGEPSLLIADEPTTALDVTVQAEILALLRHLREATGMAVLLITHDFGVLAETCDRAMVMYAGEIVEVGPVHEVLDSPLMPYTAALIRSNPSMVDVGDDLPVIEGQVPRAGAWSQGCRFRDRCDVGDDDCSVGQIPLSTVAPGRLCRCVKIGEPARATTTSRFRTSDVSRGPVGKGHPQPLLEIHNLSVTYAAKSGDVEALRDVSLSVSVGHTLGLVGGSGAGKSTVGSAVLGYVPVSGGRIVFDGRDISRADVATRRQLSRDIQVVFQDPYGSLNPSRTIGQTLSEPLRLTLGLSDNETRARVDELLEQVGLPTDTAKRYPSAFSGGQRQRISIARALTMRPRLIICDEAVSALDLSVQAQVLNLLKSLQADLGLTYLFISHDLDVVRHMADHIAVLDRGMLCEFGTASEVFDSPRHEYTRRLIDAIPSMRSPVDVPTTGGRRG